MRLLLGIILFGIWASIARVYYVCDIKNHCGWEQETTDTNIPVRPQNLSLQLGDENILEGYNQFYFQHGISQPSIDSSNTVFLDEIVAYMIDNENKKLKITGRFLESESDMTVGTYDNIGIARAAAIEEMLSDLGIPEDRISLDYSMVEGTELKEPILFEVLESDDTELADVQFTFTNMTFTESNFQFDSDVFEPKESFITYADSMKTYFDLNPDKSLRIIGHTDKIGKIAYNKDLGYRRANSAKLYLANQIGIETEIKTQSMGEKQPMATNNTASGRSRNRRVNFVIE